MLFQNHITVSINFLAILQNYKKFESRSITKCLGPLTVQTKFDGKSSFWVDAEMRQKVLGALEIAFFVRLSICVFIWYRQCSEGLLSLSFFLRFLNSFSSYLVERVMK